MLVVAVTVVTVVDVSVEAASGRGKAHEWVCGRPLCDLSSCDRWCSFLSLFISLFFSLSLCISAPDRRGDCCNVLQKYATVMLAGWRWCVAGTTWAMIGGKCLDGRRPRGGGWLNWSLKRVEFVRKSELSVEDHGVTIAVYRVPVSHDSGPLTDPWPSPLFYLLALIFFLGDLPHIPTFCWMSNTATSSSLLWQVKMWVFELRTIFPDIV